MNLEDFAKSKDIHHAVEEGYITEELLLFAREVLQTL